MRMLLSGKKSPAIDSYHAAKDRKSSPFPWLRGAELAKIMAVPGRNELYPQGVSKIIDSPCLVCDNYTKFCL